MNQLPAILFDVAIRERIEMPILPMELVLFTSKTRIPVYVDLTVSDFESTVRDFEWTMGHFESIVRHLESMVRASESTVGNFESTVRGSEWTMRHFESIVRDFESIVRASESTVGNFESTVRDSESTMRDFPHCRLPSSFAHLLLTFRASIQVQEPKLGQHVVDACLVVAASPLDK